MALQKRDSAFTLGNQFENVEVSFELVVERDAVSNNILGWNDCLDKALRRFSIFMMIHLRNTLKSEHLYLVSSKIACN